MLNSTSFSFVSLVPKKEPAIDGVTIDSEVLNLFFSGPLPLYLFFDSCVALDWEVVSSAGGLQHLHSYVSYFLGPGFRIDCCICVFMILINSDIIKNAGNFIIYITHFITHFITHL
jgi:hypothetical protein